MKQHTQNFKNEIKLMGKQQDIQIIYDESILTSEQVNSVTPSYKGNLLKSIMKQLIIDSNENIPVGTEIEFKYGLWGNGAYEYIDYGIYIVKEVKKQEDLGSYLITCYDKLLYSMKNYEKMNITYPITIKDYLKAICNHIGIGYNETSFANEIQLINTELYLDSEGNSLDYTFRDVLDEIAQVTGGIICINEDDKLEVRYINDTQDTIDEEYLKDINVNFGEKYGPINSIVLSRAGESDNIYLRDENSIRQNGLCEVKISDNQIMNFNDRDEYLPELFSKLNGVEYYINDFTSTGIMYYDLLDRYYVKIGDNIYNCLMLNDEANITQGLEELIYTEIPEQTETDYTKADKTDRRINQTYIIVDKQNQIIESVVSQTDEQNQKINRVTQTVDELNSKISDIADITVSKDSNNGLLEFENINQSEPIRIEIRPIGENISYLYPHNNLFPSNELFSKTRKIRFTNIETEEYIDYELPNDLLYYDSENYDEFILDYDSQTCLVNKRVGYNSDGTTYILETPTTIEYEYPRIPLTDGDYKVELLGYNLVYMFVRLMAQNIYTTQFATKAELNSEISQTTQNISLSVDAKLSNYSTTTQMNSAINIKSDEISSTVSKTYETKQNAEQQYSEIKQTTNNISSTVSKKVGNDEIISKINQSAEQVSIQAEKISLSGKTLNLADNMSIKSNNFNVDSKGNMSCNNANVTGGKISITGGTQTNPNLSIKDSVKQTSVTPEGIYIQDININSSKKAYIYTDEIGGGITLGGRASNDITLRAGETTAIICYGQIYANGYNNNSKESMKKNIEKFDKNMLDILVNSELYLFNYKIEKDTDKRHIGFIIADNGGNYITPEEVLTQNKDGIDIYNMASILWKCVQEQQEQIEFLKEEIKKIKESDINDKV